MKPERLLADLKRIVGQAGVSTDRGLLQAFGVDLAPFLFLEKRRGKRRPAPVAMVIPESEKQISRLLAWATEKGVPVIPYGGGSGVCGGTVPVKPSISVSLGRLNRIQEIDKISGVVRAEAGVYGPDLERALNQEGYTLGHFPASFELSTVGGWVATRSAGQNSTRYGKIEDMVIALRVVLADGRVVRTVPAPRSATGSSLPQLFLGTEGTLGIITEATLRIWPTPEQKVYQSYAFGSFAEGLDAIRKLVQAGYRPAVVRLYDENEAAWYGSRLQWEGSGALLVVVWEGVKGFTDAEAESGRKRLERTGKFTGPVPAQRWEERRFEQVEDYKKILERTDPVMAETIEISALWKVLTPVYDRVRGRVENALCTAHLSHAYPEGGGLYFTFLMQAENMPAVERLYKRIWKTVMDACLEQDAAISHHHGIGLLRAPWMSRSLGTGLDVQRQVKKALDPRGIMNPGKLGL